MKIIGLDLGSKTCGVAISDITNTIARTLITIRFNDDDYLSCAKQVIEICQKEEAETIVLGLPKHMNNDLGIRAKISEDFKSLIESNSSLSVFLFDERLTTKSVNLIMLSGNTRRDKRKEKKDELAAVVILQNYLDYKKYGGK